MPSNGSGAVRNVKEAQSMRPSQKKLTNQIQREDLHLRNK